MAFPQESTIGAEGSSLAGLCSGGDFAFQTGVRGCPGVASAVMMNPRTFLVNDLSMVDSYERARWSRESVARSDSWKNLLSGDVNLTRAFKLAAPQGEGPRREAREESRHEPHGRGAPQRSIHRTASGDRRSLLPPLDGRAGRRHLPRSSPSTIPGVDYVDANYGAAMSALSSSPQLPPRPTSTGTDHTFTARWAQERVSAMITEHLTQRFLAARAA